MTYAQVWSAVQALAQSYRRLGVGPGQRVVCTLPTTPAHLIAAHAAWACGAVHVGAHPDLTGPELAALVQRLGASTLLVEAQDRHGDARARRRALAQACPGLRRIVSQGTAEDGELALADLLAEGRHPEPSVVAPPATGAGSTDLVFLTSGTTGTAKAVCETLPALGAKVEFFAGFVSPGPGEVHLLYLPLCHAFGLKLSLLALRSGGRLVLVDRFSAAEVLDLVVQEQVRVLSGTPTHLTLLTEALDQGRQQVDTLRWVVTAAAPLAPALAEQVYGQLNAEIFVVYGCSEGFLTVTTDRHEILRGSVGSTVFASPDNSPAAGQVGIAETIADPTADPTDSPLLAPGEVGEIVYSTTMPVRYWDGPEVGADGWYRSGDLGRVDAHGGLVILGRLKELVNRGGLKVSPVEVEAALARHSAIADAAVVGTPDPVLGEAICACVVPAGPTPPTLAELRAHLCPSLARHKLPDELCTLERIPRSSLGKLDRGALRALVVNGDVPRERLRPR